MWRGAEADLLLAWDVTLADSYISTAVRGRGEVVQLAAVRKCQKYAEIPSAYIFLPIAMETLGSLHDSA